MNILMIYPKYPNTYWSFKHALRFISKRAAVPPLGLMTISAMIPENWNKKLVDMNVVSLKDEDIHRADYVMISAMYIQKESVVEVIARCRAMNTKMIAGGPLFTQDYENYPEIDHFVLNEGEITFPQFLADLASPTGPQRLYQTDMYANIKESPRPDFQILEKKNKYAFMNMQISRGCPFDCDFCEITALLGRKVRMKTTQQVIAELDELYRLNWRGAIFIVDDNFIGRRKAIKTDLLPAMTSWMKAHKYPFSFNTQTSIDLADDQELLNQMIEAGFYSTFIGIETPDEIALQSCNKVQNRNRNMIDSIKNIQQSGMQVSAGFIVGFDSDMPNIFQRQIEFINQSGIVSAMVGLLNAPKNTKLYRQLHQENRLTVDATGSNTDCSMNFVPKMNKDDLLAGYQEVTQNIYNIKNYYKRIRQFLLIYKKKDNGPRKKLEFSYLMAFFKSIFIIGIVRKGRSAYWSLLIWTMFKRPGLFMEAVTFVVYGYHFRMVYGIK